MRIKPPPWCLTSSDVEKGTGKDDAVLYNSVTGMEVTSIGNGNGTFICGKDQFCGIGTLLARYGPYGIS
jgi:hypothetical protein